MEVKISREDNVVTARLIGRLDTPASHEVAPQMNALADEAGGTIVLDCKELSYISSSGLRLFLMLRKAAAEKGGKVIVRSISGEIRSVFLMTGFLNLFEIEAQKPMDVSTDRTIPFAGVENARELGGLTMMDGRTIRTGLLVRSGNLHRATDADAKRLKDEFRLTDVFDFRYDAEAAAEPDRPMEGVRRTPLSTLPQRFIDGFSSGRADTTQVKSSDFVEGLVRYAFQPQAQELARTVYPAIVADTLSQQRYGAFLRGVLAAEGGALWHCSQGKDRAGWATAFVLGALGASRETIVDDFDLSNRYYAPYVAQMLARIDELGGGEAEKTFIRAMVGVSKENFVATLDLIDRQYGSLAHYIEEKLGFTTEEQEALRRKCLK